MPEPHQQLEDALEARRLQLRMSWADLARAAAISPQALRSIRRGEYRPSRLTARALDVALGWELGAVEAILDGDSPPATPREQLRRDVSVLETELEALLAERQGRPLNETQRDIAVTWTQTLTRALDALNEEAG